MRYLDWSSLDEKARVAALSRPLPDADADFERSVARLVADVRDRGDAALREHAELFDGVRLDNLRVDERDIGIAAQRLDAPTRDAILLAFDNIRRFHAPSALAEYAVETQPGVRCRRIVRPLARVGLYVPGGSAPLPSTVLMLGVPAMLAGCRDVVLFTPPAEGGIAPEILFAAECCGISKIYRSGGAQAIAAMAFGTESIACVDKIFGPGNRWVTEAKRQLAAAGTVSIDMPAGPSEVMVVADAAASADFIAADLLSQAEHGPDSQVLLACTSKQLIDAVFVALEDQLRDLPRAAIARQTLTHSRAILVSGLDVACDIVNRYAPEHLVLQVEEAEQWLGAIENAGSVFLGPWTPESLGDYTSGTNHVLPTNGHARQRGGLSVADFQKSFTVQQASEAGLQCIGGPTMTLACAEGLDGHASAVQKRLDVLETNSEVRRERA